MIDATLAGCVGPPSATGQHEAASGGETCASQERRGEVERRATGVGVVWGEPRRDGRAFETKSKDLVNTMLALVPAGYKSVEPLGGCALN